jgi:hypothetical protein
MSIIIKGMEMPKKDEILVFDAWHDKVYARSTANTGTRRYEVVPLPEGHGRLIDADALLERLIKTSRYFELKFDIDAAPTIVPAEGGGEE